MSRNTTLYCLSASILLVALVASAFAVADANTSRLRALETVSVADIITSMEVANRWFLLLMVTGNVAIYFFGQWIALRRREKEVALTASKAGQPLLVKITQ